MIKSTNHHPPIIYIEHKLKLTVLLCDILMSIRLERPEISDWNIRSITDCQSGNNVESVFTLENNEHEF